MKRRTKLTPIFLGSTLVSEVMRGDPIKISNPTAHPWLFTKGGTLNFAEIYSELNKIYQDPQTFNAIKVVWKLYSQYEGSDIGKPITDQQAPEIVSKFDRDSNEWKAIHDVSLFWEYVSVLVRKGYLDEEIAFEAFTSPKMLGLLAPNEKVFLEYHYSTVEINKLPLLWLYDRWKKYSRD